MPAVAVTLFVVAYTPLVARSIHVSLPSPVHAATQQSPVTPPSASAHLPTVQAATTTVPSQSCTPIDFPDPSEISLALQPVGLSAQLDKPTTYQIYGDTAAGLRTQIQHCAPGAQGAKPAEFTAETSYKLNWQYDVTLSDQGCSLADVRVGMHTATVLPYWQSTATATTGLAGRWQNFTTALATHEQGHADLDRQYATTLLSDLQAVQNVDCSTLNQLVHAVITQNVNALNSANDNYDRTTSHGATQGAVLPTR